MLMKSSEIKNWSFWCVVFVVTALMLIKISSVFEPFFTTGSQAITESKMIENFKLGHVYNYALSPNQDFDSTETLGSVTFARLDIQNSQSSRFVTAERPHTLTVKQAEDVQRVFVHNSLEQLGVYEEIPERAAGIYGNLVDKRIRLPDHRDRDTVLSLAVMAYDSYTLPNSRDWIGLDEYSKNISFGVDGVGLRGHIFLNRDESLVIIAFKGTSPIILGVGGPLAESDRFQDNLLFSCCCAHIDAWWKPVCNCHQKSDPKLQQHKLAQPVCSQSCVSASVNFKESYYNAARKIFNQVRALYPKAHIWFTGHSLGGAIASAMSLTTGYPAVAFQSPGDAMYASRLGFDLSSLPKDGSKNSNVPIIHFGNSADPIFLGKCTGISSACYLGGYAMESKCHIGKKCVYNVSNRGVLDIRYHRISEVLRKVIVPSETVPECSTDKLPGASAGDEDVCEDCTWWKYTE